MKVALYSRVSTHDQTVEPQLLELRTECQRRGWHIVADISDTISGSKFTRTGLDQLMKLVRHHSVKAVICYKLDRLGRSLHTWCKSSPNSTRTASRWSAPRKASTPATRTPPAGSPPTS